MSRRHSSRFPKTQGKKRLQVSESSFGAALFAKDPETAKALASLANDKPQKIDRSTGGPKIMPGDYSTKKNSDKNINSRAKPKRSKQKNRNQKQKAKAPLNKPLQVKRTIVKDTNPQSVAPQKTAQKIKEIPRSKRLLEAFKALDKTDGLKKFEETIDQKAIEFLDHLTADFSNYVSSDKTKGHNFYITIGFDFGTSSSKIVINAPYGDGRSFAFHVPQYFQMDNHPHLWKSILTHRQSSDTFHLFPDSNSLQIGDLKTSLMGAPNKILTRSVSAQLTAEHLCSAFIGLLLRLVKGWLWKNFKKFFGIDAYNAKIIWEANFGLPAATLDKTPELKRFELVTASAWLISETSDDLTSSGILAAFKNAAGGGYNFHEFINLRPEVAAEAIGLLRSNMADFGTYVLIDIGASTLDICVFNYVDSDEIERQVLFVAEVSLLGAECNRWLIDLNKGSDQRFSEDDLHLAIREAIGTPIVYTKQYKIPLSKVWTETLPIILAGGGRASKLHQLCIAAFKNYWLKGTDNKEISIIEPTAPTSLMTNCAQNEYHRLSVAWGLSINENDFVKIDLPKEVPEQTRKVVDYSVNFISKDVM